ncbi:FAD-dependent oxidoreductase [Corynebacterium sp. CCM 8835]|uniref:FAD-dependent oxidoreductase n=1 Tax=Corynebacterium antarcticum TaxID=2800405 RepID=A0ABS1FNK6_9CORY|nr:FAD-dependent oxidoreductase [Corynebacterium antarcticum]MCL0245210.1 FAD-dependent oxidoreductase [Corynebacterium antarcticum]
MSDPQARNPESVTVIGGGVGGFTVASELRNHGYTGPVTIIDPEGHPYDRPPLSKEMLTGEKNAEQLLLAARSWYGDNDVELVRDSVVRIDPEGRKLVLEDSGDRPFHDLVIATGGLPRQLPVPGFDNPDLLVLRSIDDARALRQKLKRGTHLAIIGAGLIGAEVASSALSLGARVTLIDPAPIALVPAVGPEIAHRLHDLHAAHDVTYLQGMTTAVHGNDGAFTIDIDGHDSVEADCVLLAVGIVAEERLAQSAELDCDGGILVDSAQRTTAYGIWAAGDCARLRTPDGHLERRHEHWESAVFEAQTAAASILGRPLPEHGASWFWTDRYGVHVECVGSMAAEGTTVVRPDADGNPGIVFRLNPDGTMAGCAAYDNGMAVRAARRIIDRGIVAAPEKLADPGINIKKLAR